MKRGVYVLLFFSTLLLVSCAGYDSGGESMDYEQTKKMVVDILKTDDGKKAIQEVLSEESTKQQLIMDQAIVKETLEQIMTNDKGKDFWKKAFEDPKFAESFAKGIQEEHKSLLKNMMKDPEYQELLMDIMKDPELQKKYQELVKSKDFRKHLQEVVMETIDSPAYKAKIHDLLIQAAKEVSTGGKEEKKEGGG